MLWRAFKKRPGEFKLRQLALRRLRGTQMLVRRCGGAALARCIRRRGM